LGLRVPQLMLRRSCRNLCRELSSLAPERHRFEKARIEDVLRKALNEDPVPLVAVATKLNKNPNWLRVNFPDVCRRLRDQYLAHQRLKRQDLMLLYEKSVQEASQDIVGAGEYPSQQRVLSVISERNPSLTNFFLTGLALKTVRIHLASCPSMSDQA